MFCYLLLEIFSALFLLLFFFARVQKCFKFHALFTPKKTIMKERNLYFFGRQGMMKQALGFAWNLNVSIPG